MKTAWSNKVKHKCLMDLYMAKLKERHDQHLKLRNLNTFKDFCNPEGSALVEKVEKAKMAFFKLSFKIDRLTEHIEEEEL